MGTPHIPPLLVVADSNIPLDLVLGREAVLDAIAVIRRRLCGGRILIPPRVVREIAFLSEFAEEEKPRAPVIATPREIANNFLR